MKLTLMIEGSADVLAAVLANLPSGASATAAPLPVPTPIAAGAPGQGGFTATPPLVHAAAPTSGEDDEGEPNAAPPELDSRGIPWDDRIHAGTKATNKDGSWRNKRGVDATVIGTVEAELRARGAAHPMPPVAAAPVYIPPVPMQPTPLPVAPQPVAPAIPPMPLNPEPPAMTAPPIPAPAPAPIPQPAPAPVPAPPPMPTPQQAAVDTATNGALDFAGFMAAITPKMQTVDANGLPVINADYLESITKEIGIAFAPYNIPAPEAITDIAGNQQMIAYAVQLLQRDGKW